jgi:hypothetical protein
LARFVESLPRVSLSMVLVAPGLEIRREVCTEYVSEEINIRNGNIISGSENHGEDFKVVMLGSKLIVKLV